MPPAPPTLSPTALVHELWLKLAAASPAIAHDRAHFLRIAARAMRQLVVDARRERQALKRGGGEEAEPLEAALGLALPDGVELLALDQALGRLAAEDPLAAEVVELRCFAGLTIAETAALQARHPSAVNRDWAYACAFLRNELGAR
ncbi:MAG: ECF-type sigma factor [Xanthomonadales bacterium]|nr:ECF-type sigma factor [Xanthomonadales bacterium]